MNWISTLAIAAASLAGAVGAALTWGAWSWQSDTEALHRRLHTAQATVTPTRVDLRDLDALPAPVLRYLRLALQDGQAMPSGLRFRHRGTFNLGEREPRWGAFSSEQIVTLQPPGFDWHGRIQLGAGLHATVHDAYVAGEGLLVAKLMGLVPLADLRGTPEAAQGELMRYLAEAVWYPTALLPSQGVQWQAIDERSARATLIDGTTTASLVFGFGADGLPERVGAEARPRTVGKQVIATPWEVRVWNYQVRDGLRIPVQGEVAWRLPSGSYPYWRGTLEAIAFERAR